MTIRHRVKTIIIVNPHLHKVAKLLKQKIYKYNTETKTTSISYTQWIKDIEPSVWNQKPQNTAPLISIVVPAYNTQDKYILPLIDSLIEQTYNNWELCLVDGSTDTERSNVLEKYSQRDKRIVYKRARSNLGISGNTNVGLGMAKGEYIGLLDHDDTLSPHAINEVVHVINKNPKVEIIYSDEDKLSDDGKERQLPFFKPDWSPDLLLGVNYITHFLVIKRSLIAKIGGLRPEFDGAQDYDLLLRVTEVTDKIIHIPKILYHWRMADGSTAKVPGEKNYADGAGQAALRDAVKRRKVAADVIEIPDQPTNYRLRYKLPAKQPKVSIIIPFKDKPELLKKCVESIFSKTLYKNYEVILLSNNSMEESTSNLVKKLEKNEKIKVYTWDHPFNYSKINNYGVSKATGEYIVLLNNDTEVITPSWLNELLGVATQPGVGAVGPMLLYPEHKNGIQHAGVVLGMGTMAGHVFRHHQPLGWTDFGLPAWPRNYLAVTAACLVVSKDIYNKVGGLDEEFIVAGNDIAFCLRLHEAGYRNIYWPFARLLHYESVSVGTYNNGIKGDYDKSLEYYKPYHKSGDPYFNKNLDLMNEQIGIKGII